MADKSGGEEITSPDFQESNFLLILLLGITSSDDQVYNLEDFYQQLNELLLQKHSENLIRSILDEKKKKKDVVSNPPSPRQPLQQEDGGPSSVPCLICSDQLPPSLIWCRLECKHSFCMDCIQDYARRTSQENPGQLKCPVAKCDKMMPSTTLHRIIPDEVLERWVRSLQEGDALANPRVIVCPFPNCGGVFLDDKKQFLIRACPHCWKVFCMECRVSWHLGMSCEDFMMLLIDEL